jgi:hypothetical protein
MGEVGHSGSGVRGFGEGGEQGAGGRGDIGLAHQRFADQERARAGALQPRDIRRRGDAAFGDQQPIPGHTRRQPLEHRQVDAQALEVAIVDADQVRIQAQRAVQLGLVVSLGENVEAERSRLPGEGDRRRVVECRENEQQAIRAERAGLDPRARRGLPAAHSRGTRRPDTDRR